MRRIARTALFVMTCSIVLVVGVTGCTRANVTPKRETAPVKKEAPSETVATTSTGESNPQTDKVTVPDVVSRGMTSARMVLGMNHLTFEVVSDPPDADLPMDNSVTVIKQDPPADAIVDSGSSVTLIIKAK